MKIDLETYKISKQPVISLFLRKNEWTISRAVAELACTSNVPCIVIAYWIGEVTNWPNEIVEKIQILNKFYGYTDILNKPENCPI